MVLFECGSGENHMCTLYGVCCCAQIHGRYQEVIVTQDSLVTISDVTESSAVVTWKTIEGLPDDIKQYYKYILEYKEAGPRPFVEFATLDHNPDASNSQQETLTDLRYDQLYVIQVRSVRTVRGLTEETENTRDPRFRTKCLGMFIYIPCSNR